MAFLWVNGSPSKGWLNGTFWNGLGLAIDFSKDNVLSSDDGHYIRHHVSSGHEIQSLKVCQSRSTDLATVGTVGSIRRQVDPNSPLGASMAV